LLGSLLKKGVINKNKKFEKKLQKEVAGKPPKCYEKRIKLYSQHVQETSM